MRAARFGAGLGCLVAILFWAAAGWAADAAGGAPVLAEVLSPQAGLAGTLRLTVDNLGAIDPTRLRLRLDEHLFADLAPQHRREGEVAFDLTGLHGDKAGWALLVGHPPVDGTKLVKVALSRTDGMDVDPAPGLQATLTLRIFAWWRILAGAAAVAGLVWAVLRLGARTDALRDGSGPAPAAGLRRPYSLGRCQMAFWFTLLTGAFVMIWLVTGDYNAIVSSQSLTLLGISGTTAIAAASIDAGRPGAGAAHVSFWADLLQDSTGWAFHRLQVLVWTVLLGAISLWSAYDTLALPNFDDNLLILMGVSSGVYIGFKFPEQP